MCIYDHIQYLLGSMWSFVAFGCCLSGTDAFIAHLEKAGWPLLRWISPGEMSNPQWFSCNSRYSIPIWSISIGIHSPLTRIFKYSLSFALFRDAETSTHQKTDIIKISVGKAKVRCAWPEPAIWKPVHPLDLFYQRRPRVDSATFVMTCYSMLSIYEHKSDIIRQAIQLFYQSRSAIVGQPY